MDESIKQKKWIFRNWKWIVPSIGCLTIIIVVVLLAGTMISKVTGLFKDSVPYTVGMDALLKNELVIEILGEPIETNGMFKGNINYDDGNGSADLKIPVKGPKGEASLLIIAKRINDVWIYQTMGVTINGTQEVISLLPLNKNLE